ncbi:MAG: hypothetical protein LBJ22_00335 [Synergistaceae bacterium]|jgi:hypothetical protein|nr:hypothetical protein [Synergistaceae bacterium]
MRTEKHTYLTTAPSGNGCHRFKLAMVLAVSLSLLVVLGGCGGSSSDSEFNLAGLDNPFIGKWQSDIPSANTTLIFDYKDDGTFEYEMVGVPENQGGKGTGGYVAHDGIQVTWLDFEGAAAYTFKVVDNDTINVTELEVNENGEQATGNTAPFKRVEGSEVNTKDIPFRLVNTFIGKWKSEIPSANATLIFDYKDDGTFEYEMVGVPEDQGGKGTGCYIVFGNKMVSYLDFEGVASYSFEVVDADTVDVTELEPNESGELVPGNTAPFIRVR